MPRYFIVREQDSTFSYDSLLMLQNPESLGIVSHPIRVRMLKLLAEQPMYPAELAKKMRMHEQKVYYHIKQLLNANVLELREKKDIRGTTAKKYAPKGLSFAVSLASHWESINKLMSSERERKIDMFLKPFIESGRLNAKVVVGSPDPHGPFKARARDGHYAVDLALFLGRFCSMPKQCAVNLDVDIELKTLGTNLILVGGPVTNLLTAKINDFLPAKFSDSKPWGIVSNDSYTDDSVGLVARIPNPYNPELGIIALAGIRYSGTKAAVIALTRFNQQVLQGFTNQKSFFSIVQGFDLDGDGSIDS
ncbi:MAG: helix-turn-helix domain-containing protein, partial [Candidatus Woesearchaeota archaeon]